MKADQIQPRMGNQSDEALHHLIAPTPGRVLATAGVYAMLAMPLIWHLALEGWEKEHFRSIVSRVGMRVGGTA